MSGPLVLNRAEIDVQPNSRRSHLSHACSVGTVVTDGPVGRETGCWLANGFHQ